MTRPVLPKCVSHLAHVSLQVHVDTLSSFSKVSFHVFPSKGQKCIHAYIESAFRILEETGYNVSQVVQTQKQRRGRMANNDKRWRHSLAKGRPAIIVTAATSRAHSHLHSSCLNPGSLVLSDSRAVSQSGRTSGALGNKHACLTLQTGIRGDQE